MKKIINWGSFDLGKVIQKMTGRSSPSGVGTGLHDQDLGDGSSSPTTTWFWEFITIMTSKMVLDASSLSWKSPPSNLKCQKWCRFLKYSRASALITIKTYHKLVSFVKTEKVEMKYKNCTILQNSNKKWFIISSDKRHLLIFENYPKIKRVKIQIFSPVWGEPLLFQIEKLNSKVSIYASEIPFSSAADDVKRLLPSSYNSKGPKTISE